MYPPPDSQTQPAISPLVSSKNCKDAATTCKDCGDAAITSPAGVEPARPAPALTLAQVNPDDYSPIPEGPLIEPCLVCGSRVVYYTERFQARQAQGVKERSRHICRSCYNRARGREQAAVQVLPGAIPLDEVEPVEARPLRAVLGVPAPGGGIQPRRQRDRDLPGLL